MKASGLSDSIASVADELAICPTCGGAVRVRGGSCVSCLLLTGLASDGSDPNEGGKESFDAVLAEIDVPDSDWRLGNYLILEEIGRGGMGVIYRAQQRHSRRIVALKRVLSYHGDSRDTLDRFRREAEAVASLDHPNVLPIYEVGEADGLPFFTMKFAPGGTLQQAAAALSAEPRECVRLLAKVTRAVAFAHKQGILHRDLKPGNILLDGHGEPLVSDFGLAKWMDASSDLTRSLAVYGTPGFIAPEQAEGKRDELGPAADIYSLGAILFDLLAGRPPFLGEHAIAVIRQAADKPAPKLRSLLRTTDRDLETICAKCLEREPAARYRSATELAEDLERWLEGRPIVARPVLAPTQAWRWSKRNPLLASTIALCLFVGAIAVTRQIENWRWQQEIRAQLAAHHSIKLIPLLDIDTVQPAEEWSRRFVAELRQQMESIGPANISLAASSLTPPVDAATVSPSGNAPARAILVGTIRTLNGKSRVSLHLLDAATQAPLLHKLIETDRADASNAARQLAGAAYRLLSVADLSSAGPRNSDPGLTDREANNFIAQGIALADRVENRDLDRSVTCLEHAITLQPDSSAAHAALARVLTYKAAFQSTRDHLPEALEHARKSLALNPSSSEAYISLAAALHHYGRMAESTEHTLLALEHSAVGGKAANLLSNNYKFTGRPDKALIWTRLQLPGRRSGSGTAPEADCLVMLGDDESAEELYNRHQILNPEKPDGWLGICRLRALEGRVAEARALYRNGMKNHADFGYTGQMAAQAEFFGRDFAEAERLYTLLYDRNPGGGGNFYGAITYASALGRIKLDSDPARGRDLLEAARRAEIELSGGLAENPGPLYRLASIDASLGATESAFQYLDAAISAGWIDFRSTAADPRFDSIRGDERFDAQISRMKNRVAELNAGDKRSAVRSQKHD